MPESAERIHPFEPIYDSRSSVLILGTMPSPATLADGFYYGHPRNRFWPLLAALTDSEIPRSRQGKTNLLVGNRLAIWDVLHSCKITGASDSSITDPIPNDIGRLLQKTGIKRIYANGSGAESLYRKFIFPQTAIPIIRLPSTSPANAAFSFETLLKAWEVIMK